MKTFMLSLVAIASALGQAETGWRIERVEINPLENGNSVLIASIVSGSGGERFDLSGDVVLNKVYDAYISGEKLVLLGGTRRAAAVEIFDLSTRAKIDWFVCYEPHRISDNWIEYVEFYSARSPGEPTDVVVIYDLTKTPFQNRPERRLDERIRVGTPIYPPINAISFSFDNIGDIPGTASAVLGQPFVLLRSNILVFKVAEGPGYDATRKREHLAAVDLSRGLANPRSRRIEIPREVLRRKGATSPLETISVTRMGAASPTSVQLIFPPGQYALDSLIVEVSSF